MVRPNLTADQQLSLAYAATRAAPIYGGLFRLEMAMAQIAFAAHEPLLAQIKLAWWAEDGLNAPKGGSALGDAILDLAASADHRVIVPPFVEAWKAVASGPDYFEEAAMLRAEAWTAALNLVDPDLILAVQAWAKLDLLLNTGTNGDPLPKAFLLALRRQAKPLAVLAVLASGDAQLIEPKRSKQGSPKRMARAFMFILTGLIL